MIQRSSSAAGKGSKSLLKTRGHLGAVLLIGCHILVHAGGIVRASQLEVGAGEPAEIVAVFSEGAAVQRADILTDPGAGLGDLPHSGDVFAEETATFNGVETRCEGVDVVSEASQAGPGFAPLGKAVVEVADEVTNEETDEEGGKRGMRDFHWITLTGLALAGGILGHWLGGMHAMWVADRRARSVFSETRPANGRQDNPNKHLTSEDEQCLR